MAGRNPKPGRDAGTAAPKERRSNRDRRTEAERRSGQERRKASEPVAIERRGGKDRRAAGPDAKRRKVERRINEYRLEPEVLEFIKAINDFKTVHQKPFPTWSEIYKVFLSLGYRKT